MISLTDEQSLAVHGFQFWPAKFGFDGYLFLVQFKDKILQALFITLFVTIVGTACNVFITTTYAYAISRSTFKYRKFFTVFSLLSMLFSAGLVPSYIVTTQLLQLGDTIGALIGRFVIAPALIAGLILLGMHAGFNVPGLEAQTLIIQAAAPGLAVLPILATEAHADVEYATNVVTTSTVLFVVVVPILMMLVQGLA